MMTELLVYLVVGLILLLVGVLAAKRYQTRLAHKATDALFRKYAEQDAARTRAMREAGPRRFIR